jgi:hypothetical protein
MTKQIAVALVALAILIGATVAADRVVAAPVQPTEQFTDQAEVRSGTWYCNPLTREGEAATLSVAAVGSDPSEVSIQRVAEGAAEFEAPITLNPKATHEQEVEGGERPAGFVVRWRGGPVVASWRVDGEQHRVGSSCAQSPAPEWLVPGADTTVGSSSRLYLFNPFSSDAVVRVAFATSQGRIDLVSSENVSVPAHDVVDLAINELQPEQSDLGVIVEVQAGRVIASGLQNFGQPDLPDIELEGAEPPTDPNDPEGRVALPATGATSPTVGLAYAASGEATSAWVSVVNPNNRPARVSVEVSDAIEGAEVEQEVTVAPDSVARVDLTGMSSAPNFGVTLTAADDLPIAATGFVALTGERKRVSAMSTVGEADTLSAQPTVPPGAAAEIALYNPGQADATVTVAVGGQVPDQWSAIELPAGAMQLLPFADAGLNPGGGAGESASEGGQGDAGDDAQGGEDGDAQGDEDAQGDAGEAAGEAAGEGAGEAASEGAGESAGGAPAAGGGPIEASADQPILATLRFAAPGNRLDQFLTVPLVPANVWQGSADAPTPQRDRALDTRPVDFPAEVDR